MSLNNIGIYNKTAFSGISAGSYIKQPEECVKKKGVRTQTSLFRDYFNWDKFSDYVIENYSPDTKIFNFACSDGSEVYSLKMLMDKKLKTRKKQNAFEYQAFDINEDIIKKDKKRVIKLDCDDKKRFENHMCDGFDNYFEKVEGKKRKHKVISPDLLEIPFEYGDITKWAKQKQDKPCIVMFRNAWPYLKNGHQKELLNNLYKNLPSGSLLVVGHFDSGSYNFVENIHNSKFERQNGFGRSLYDAGFVYKRP